MTQQNKVIDEQSLLEIKKVYNELAMFCLECADVHKTYSDEDLLNATLIFQEVFMNKMFDYDASKEADINVMTEHAVEAGIRLRTFIKDFTNIDMHDIAKK